MPAPVQIACKAVNPPRIGENNYRGLLQKSEVLPQNWQGFGSSLPLPCEILVEHDVAVQLRDGCTIYVDVYRPPTAGPKERVPAVLSWSPFGKKFNGLRFLNDMTAYKMGVKDECISGLEKFEGIDPAKFVDKGFAVVNVDPRGVGDSEGLCVVMGAQEGEDGYDAIEAVAKMDWCNGSVGMAGNSHLAVVQWFIAQLNPPSLKAIAPWEGCGDLYREQFVRGGIYAGSFYDHISQAMIRGRYGMEDFNEMYRRNPLVGPYWDDKRPDMRKIKVPAYITASFNSPLHTMGSIRAYMEISNPNKWIRFSPYQEWHDLWAVEKSSDEMLSFFECYLKGVDNGWDKTPHVRMTTLRFGSKDAIMDSIEDDYPIPRTVYSNLYLGPNGSLNKSESAEGGSISHDSELASSYSAFTHTFSEKTTLCGIPKAVLYMSCASHNDLDVYVILRKLDVDGSPMLCLNVPWASIPPNCPEDIPAPNTTDLLVYRGPIGMLRASHRKIDGSKSMHPNYPFHPHQRLDKIPPGDVVKLEIGLFAMSIEYEAGESLQVRVYGQTPQGPMFDELKSLMGTKDNKGHHTVHFGGSHPSHIVLPFV